MDTRKGKIDFDSNFVGDFRCLSDGEVLGSALALATANYGLILYYANVKHSKWLLGGRGKP